jgi:hypothetical protein
MFFAEFWTFILSEEQFLFNESLSICEISFSISTVDLLCGGWEWILFMTHYALVREKVVSNEFNVIVVNIDWSISLDVIGDIRDLGSPVWSHDHIQFTTLIKIHDNMIGVKVRALLCSNWTSTYHCYSLVFINNVLFSFNQSHMNRNNRL